VAKSGPRSAPVNGDELRNRLIDATVEVLAREGFARTSARAIAAAAGTVNGSIFYYFGSMDGLLAATASALADRGIERIRQGLGGDRASQEWPARLGAVMRAEAEGTDGRAVMELFVGARGSPALASEVGAAIDRAIGYATAELHKVIGDSPLGQVLPVPLVAEVAAAAFLGLEILAQNGRAVDVDQLARTLAAALQLARGSSARA
jgi:AcrR family transcriptional regulator